MSEKMEDMILERLVSDDTFSNRAAEVIQSKFFSGEHEQKICLLIKDHWTRFGRKPTWDSLEVEASSLHVSEETHKQIIGKIAELRDRESEVDSEWLLKSTQDWMKVRSVNCAVMDAIQILDGRNNKLTMDSLPGLFEEALGISLENSIGHDYFRDAESQHDYYIDDENHISTGLRMFDLITNGGTTRKTLNVFMSTKTGGFKTGTKCHIAAHSVMSGLNVAYFSMEMSENKIRERIDANLLRISVDSVCELPKDAYLSRIGKLKEMTKGTLKIKEFPTSSTHVGHFRFILKQWKAETAFVPDVILFDYLNICASQRIKADAGSFSIGKAVAEELRGLCVEYNAVGWSSNQSNRGGFNSGDDIDLDDTSESFGMPNALDLFLGIITNDELDAKGMLMYKQLKNRYKDLATHKKFMMGVDKSQMRLFDLPFDDPRDQIAGHRVATKAVEQPKEQKESSFKGWNFG
jgi:replicative DNA helicase